MPARGRRHDPQGLWPEIAQLGLGGIYVSEEQGGSGLSRLDAALVFEALAMACPSVGSFLSIHNMCAGMIDKFGSAALKAEWLPRLCSMETVMSYCLTEPGSGSDAAALKTRAVRDNEGWRLTGTKAFISGGGYSDAYIVMCRTGDDGPKGVSAIILEDGAEGLSFGGLEDKMGWRSQPTAQVQMDGAKAPAANLIGEEGKGFSYAMAGLDGGRLNIAASARCAGRAERRSDLYGRALRLGQTLDQFQTAVQAGGYGDRLQASRVFLRQAAWKLDNGAPDAIKHCAMAKRFVTDAAFRVANDALQLHGGYGYLADYGIEKIVRDLRIRRFWRAPTKSCASSSAAPCWRSGVSLPAPFGVLAAALFELATAGERRRPSVRLVGGGANRGPGGVIASCLADLESGGDDEGHGSGPCRLGIHPVQGLAMQAAASFDVALAMGGRMRACLAARHAHQRLLEHDHAIADFSAALAFEPRDKNVLTARGVSYLLKGVSG